MVRSGKTLPGCIGGLLVFDIEVRGVALPRQRGVMLVVIDDAEVVGLLTGQRHIKLQTTGAALKIT